MAPKIGKKEINKDLNGNKDVKLLKKKDKITNQQGKDKNKNKKDGKNNTNKTEKDKKRAVEKINKKQKSDEKIMIEMGKKEKKDLKEHVKNSDSFKNGKNDKKKNNRERKPNYRKDKNQMAKEKKNIEYGIFLMKKGDKYTGYYYRNSHGDVFRHGRGIYETSDGQTYEGLWSMDHLVNNEPVKIVYEDGCMYEGTLQNYLYDGYGKYTFSNGAKLQCNFRKNKPFSKIQLIDPNGNVWIGQSVSERNCLLQLRNIFYRNIPQNLGLPSYELQFGQGNDEDTNFDRAFSFSRIEDQILSNKSKYGSKDSKSVEKSHKVINHPSRRVSKDSRISRLSFFKNELLKLSEDSQESKESLIKIRTSKVRLSEDSKRSRES